MKYFTRLSLVFFIVAIVIVNAGSFYWFVEGTSFGVSSSFAPLVVKTLTTDGHTIFTNSGGGTQVCNGPDCAYVTAISGSIIGTYTTGCEASNGTTVCRAPLIDDPYFGAHTSAALWYWQDGATNDLSAVAGSGNQSYGRLTDLFARRAPACTTAGITCHYITSTIIARAWPSGSYAVFETERAAYNTDVRNGCLSSTTVYSNGSGGVVLKCAGGSPFTYVCDDAADTRIGIAGDETNTTYFNVDGVHLNNTGYTVIFNPLVVKALEDSTILYSITSTANIGNSKVLIR